MFLSILIMMPLDVQRLMGMIVGMALKTGHIEDQSKPLSMVVEKLDLILDPALLTVIDLIMQKPISTSMKK